jgi:POT family proton-dependent oligopeptide transporter
MFRKHPKALYVLFFTEMWERFGYYLMVGILLLYLIDNKTGGKGFDTRTAADIVGSFIALVYLTPFIGGLLADRYLGYLKSIFIGGSLMAAGYFGLAIPGDTAMFVSLGFIIVGNGFFKPNMSTLLGIIYNKDELKPLKDNAYSIFYMGVNIGALICNFVAAYLRNKYGWGYAFSAAGVGLVFALIWLASGLKHVKHANIKKPMEKEDASLTKIVLYVFLPAVVFGIIGWMIPDSIMGSDSNDAFIFACIPIISFYVSLWMRSSGQNKRAIGALFFIYTCSIIFWIIYNQNATGLTIWAESHTDRKVTPVLEESAGFLDMLQEVNPLLKEVPKVDQYFRPVLDENGIMIMTLGPDPYFNNLPKEEWPGENENLKLVNAELFQSINPFFIIVFTPLIVGLFGWLARRKKEPTTAAKFGLALFIAGLSSLVMVFAIISVSSVYTHKTAAYWLFLTYGIFTVSELFLSPIGLSLVSKLSPARTTALMMGGWYLSTSLGGKAAGIMASFWNDFTDKTIFFLIITIAAFVGGALIFSRIKSLNAIVKEKTGSAA